jgi:hypothetical protein
MVIEQPQKFAKISALPLRIMLFKRIFKVAAEILIRPVAPGKAHHRKIRRQILLLEQMEKRRSQFPLHQIPSGAEYYQDRGLPWFLERWHMGYFSMNPLQK